MESDQVTAVVPARDAAATLGACLDSLLEILAVLLIGALLMSVTLPNFGALQSHRLQNSAEQIVERIDFGRQRAVMTGIPHRLAIDLDAGTYKLEWQGLGAKDVAPQPKPELEPGIEAPLSLGQQLHRHLFGLI